MRIMIPSESTRFNRRIDCALNIVQCVWGILRWHTGFYSPFWIVICLDPSAEPPLVVIHSAISEWKMIGDSGRGWLLLRASLLYARTNIYQLSLPSEISFGCSIRISTKRRTHKLETHSTTVRYQIAASWPALYNACYLVMLLV